MSKVNKPKAIKMSGLEEVGIPGKEYLRESLTNCSDPLRAIEEFQIENGILLPSLRPMLPLLDLHGVRRLEFHLSVLDELKEKLLQQIEALGKQERREKDKKLKELLQKSFPVIKVPTLRPIVMGIMKNMERLEDKYLKQIVVDKTLYNECDVHVKRQIWQDNQALFGDEVSPLLTRYVEEKQEQLLSCHETSNFFLLSPKQRRQADIIQKLINMIGRNIQLYDMVLQFIRTLFLRTKNIHYCTLRAELLMAMHDLEIQEITSIDPCHKFTWCLDACIREKNVNVKKSRELQGFLDGIKRGQEHVMGDLSMVLGDAYAVNFLATAALKILNFLINNDSLPRDNQVLLLLLRMLSLSLHSWEIINSQVFKEPKLDVQVVTKFLPALMSLMVDDQIRFLSSRLPSDDREIAITTIEHSGPPPDAYQAYIQENGVASVIAMYYTLHSAKQKDRQGLMRVLGTLNNCEKDKAFEDPFLHNLVSLLVILEDEFAAEDFCTIIFDEFFMTNIMRENVSRHLIKLLWHVHTKLPASRLEAITTSLLQLSQHNTELQSHFDLLQERINSSQPSATPQNVEALPLPILSVPTPSSLSPLPTT